MKSCCLPKGQVETGSMPETCDLIKRVMPFPLGLQQMFTSAGKLETLTDCERKMMRLLNRPGGNGNKGECLEHLYKLVHCPFVMD